MTGFFDFADSKEAITSQDFKELKTIIDQEGARFFIGDDDDRGNPIIYSQRIKHQELEKFLQEQMIETFFDLLHNPHSIDYDMMEQMLQHDDSGLLLEREGPSGANALYYACVVKQDPHMARILIDYGADVEHRNNHNGLTILEALEKKERILQRNAQELTPQARDNISHIQSLIHNPFDLESEVIVEKKEPMTSSRVFDIANELGVAFKKNPVTKKYEKKGKKKREVGQTLSDITVAEAIINDGVEQQLIHAACVKGKLEHVQELIDAGADINSTDEIGLTPLYYACYSGNNTGLIHYLIDNGADSSVEDREGHTLLHVLSGKENWLYDQEKKEIAILLIDNGVDPTIHDNHGVLPHLYLEAGLNKQTALYVKEQSNRITKMNIAECNAFFEKNPSLYDDLLSYEGQKLSSQHVQNVVKTLSFGMGENIGTDAFFISQVMYELCNSKFLCDQLFSHQVDKHKKIISSFAQINPDHVALIPDIVEDLDNASMDDVRKQIIRISYVTAKDLMVSYKNKVTSQNMISTGDQKSGTSTTYLNAACKAGNMHLADLLLDDLFQRDEDVQKAILNYVDDFGGTSILGYCSIYNNDKSLAVAKKILDSGHAQFNISGVISPMSFAISYKNKDFIELLSGKMMESGLSVDTHILSGVTPLEFSMSANNVDAVRFFMEKGADQKLVSKNIKAQDNEAIREFKSIMRDRIKSSLTSSSPQPQQAICLSQVNQTDQQKGAML